jgi:lipopolysaccharide/colanic/teichoic acid biosynthesis glycosyltransferase
MHCVLLLTVDLLLLLFANALAMLISIGSQPSTSEILSLFQHCGLTIALAVPALLASALNRTLWRFTSLHDCLRVITAVLITMAATAAARRALPFLQDVPETLIGLQFLLMTSILIGARALIRLKHARRSRRRRGKAFVATCEDILVVGVNAMTVLFLRSIAESAESRVAVAGILSESARHRGRLLGAQRILGRPDEIGQISRELAVHGVNIAGVVLTTPFNMLPPHAQHALLQANKDSNIWIEGIDERFSPQQTGKKSQPHASSSANGVLRKMPPLPIATPGSYPSWKRAFDIAASMVSAICLAPLMLMVGAAVLVDVGYPIIFWQQRPGALGRPIRVLKFRTMRAARNADGARLSDLERLSVVGKFLRRMRLDELPQIYNVLAGEMSLVGPRPLLPIDQSHDFRARLELKPGLTGWAQINGGRHLSINDKAVLDLWYVKNACFSLDIQILFKTARTVLLGERVNPQAVSEAWRALDFSPSECTAHSAEEDREQTFRAQPRPWLKLINISAPGAGTENAQPQ